MSLQFEEEEIGKGLKLDREHRLLLWGYVRPHLRLFLASFFALVTLFAIDLTLPWIVKHIVDGPVTLFEKTGVFEPDQLLPWLLGFTGLLGLQGFTNYKNVVWTSMAGQAVVRDLRVSLFRHTLHLSPDFFDRIQTGRLVTRISSDCENLSELFTTGAVATLADALKVVGFLVAMLFISPALALVVLAAAPFLVLFTLGFQHRARVEYRKVRGRISRLTGFFAEAIQGLRVTRLFGQEDKIGKGYDAINLDVRKAWMMTIALFSLYFSLIDFGTYGTQAAILWRAGFSISLGELSYGDFIQFWLYFGLMVGPLRSLGEKYNILQSAFASAERIFQILDEKPSLPEAENAIQPSRGPAAIRFDHVDFEYNPGVPVLRDVSFEIPAGSRAAVVGPTGAGKTTLIALLARFRDPQGGKIFVGDHELRDFDLRAHRRRIGIVLQDVFLFAANMLENVRLWEKSIGETRVLESLESVQALDLVEKTGGLEAIVEERGATLSQGERQLLAFARALVHDPDILVLDEATANIDTQTEQRIQSAMEVLMRGRTTVVIAHRLSTVREADTILVMDQGRVVEQGKHDELLAAGGLYASLIHSLGNDGDS